MSYEQRLRRGCQLWFEYLRLARDSDLPKVRNALMRLGNYYEDWGGVSVVEFDEWWKVHRFLFSDPELVREIFDRNELPEEINGSGFDGVMFLEIRLLRSPTVLAEMVKRHLKVAMIFTKPKSRRRSQARFQFTENSEPKFDALEVSLRVYRDVHLKDRNLDGQPLLRKVREYFIKNVGKIPSHLGDSDPIDAARNVNRYIHKARQVMLSVASGQFPGKLAKRRRKRSTEKARAPE